MHNKSLMHEFDTTNQPGALHHVLAGRLVLQDLPMRIQFGILYTADEKSQVCACVRMFMCKHVVCMWKHVSRQTYTRHDAHTNQNQ